MLATRESSHWYMRDSVNHIYCCERYADSEGYAGFSAAERIPLSGDERSPGCQQARGRRARYGTSSWRLVVAEKPSVAGDMSALGVTARRRGAWLAMGGR